MTARRARHGVADSYIVRIYRRSEQPGHEVAGLVEPVEYGERRAFAGRDELWAALTGLDGATGGSARVASRRRRSVTDR